MAEYVDLDQKVDAQYYDEMNEERSLKTTTIGHILDSVCDDYKIAVDVVEVVRCKDCKYYDKSTHNCGLYGVKHWGGFFCGDAKEEDEDNG